MKPKFRKRYSTILTKLYLLLDRAFEVDIVFPALLLCKAGWSADASLHSGILVSGQEAVLSVILLALKSFYRNKD